MGKTFNKQRGELGEKEHFKSASRRGHSHSAKYKKQGKTMQHSLPNAMVKRLIPSDLLHNEEFVNGLDYDD
jgi:hypothetical protein